MVVRNSKRPTRSNRKMEKDISEADQSENVSMKIDPKQSKNEEFKKPSDSNRRMREEDQDSEYSDFEN